MPAKEVGADFVVHDSQDPPAPIFARQAYIYFGLLELRVVCAARRSYLGRGESDDELFGEAELVDVVVHDILGLFLCQDFTL